jgi:hypothetical protein
MGPNVAASGDVDEVIRGADDAPAAGGDDFDEWSIVNGAGRENAPPFGLSGGVVEAEDAGGSVSGFTKLTDWRMAIFCHDLRIATQTIHRSRRQTSCNAGGVDLTVVTSDAPLVRGRRRRADRNAERAGVH